MITRSVFGTLPGGETVERIELTLANGFSAAILTWGATLQSLRSPDREGRFASVVLGYTTLDDYRNAGGRLGATMGRYANRIENGHFHLDGQDHQLQRNEGRHAIHGGPEGFDRRLWSVESILDLPDRPEVRLRLESPDGDQGFPGRLVLTVSYALKAPGDLVISYEASSDRPTVFNTTNHAYFNLAGEGSGSVLDHRFTIPADRFLPVNDELIPTGEIRNVDGTEFDFREARPLAAGIRADDPQIRLGRGYDHCYVLSENGPEPYPRLAARVEEEQSGRQLEVLTTEPGLQLHSGNVLTGRYHGASGRAYRQSDGFCLEAQHFPNAPNAAHFPSTVLRPGKPYRSITIYRLGITPSLARS
ncbi:galactose mutarotase [Chromobacterium sphagni]|uniref:Aldose 1-epimerase n=1 Tax=Chromobacterium sphagni TaxID=1903179 RepID=A0A1S1X489_9NEIS|nr:aldose epimerase family protein [Chromobacterium sphagni]OHX14274.1 galactose mutarotase [Chromobacterium sphagni]